MASVNGAHSLADTRGLGFSDLLVPSTRLDFLDMDAPVSSAQPYDAEAGGQRRLERLQAAPLLRQCISVALTPFNLLPLGCR